MPVLKAQATQRVRESAIVMDLSDLEREAARLVSQAQAEAARIVSEAKSAAEREQLKIREQARQAGHREGMAAGLQEGKKQGHDEAVAAVGAQLKELTARWSQTLELLHQHMPVHLGDVKTDLLKLALAIAARVTHAEALRNREVAPAVAAEALAIIGAARRVALHVNPAEEKQLEQYLPEILGQLRQVEEVELIADDAVSPGGCVLRLGSGEVDAQMETQLARISEEILGGEAGGSS